MINEIEEITDLYDEFFIIDSSPETKPQPQIKKTEEVISEPKPEPVAVKETEIIKPVEVSLPSLIFSGANKRLITVIYNDKNNDSRENVEMLSNLITKALKFSMDDIAIVRLSKNPDHKLSDIFAELTPEKAIIWGIDDFIGSSQINNKIHALSKLDNTVVLIADEVSKYHNNAAYKGELWNSIQKLFA